MSLFSGAGHGSNDVVGFPFAIVVTRIGVPSIVMPSFIYFIVLDVVASVVTVGTESFSFFVLFISPLLHHEFEFFDIGWSSVTEVLVCSSIIESVLEALNDVCFGDVHYSSLLLEEPSQIVAQGLALFLLNLS